MQESVKALNQLLKGKTTQEIIDVILKKFGKKIGFANSLGLEDQVITDMICKADKNANIFTLDTGRLFPETYSLIDKTNMKYGINIKVYFPEYNTVQEMVTEKGVNLFYESVEQRKRCCHVRKIEPLNRAFNGLEAWICGLRREQSVTRTEVDLVDWDEANNIIKINPLYNWTEQQVWDYVKTNAVPYNKLHDQGFASIGCQPCTRAVIPGEDIRAGRWWWENPDQKECGLHKR